MAEDRIYLHQKYESPRMDRSVPYEQVKKGSLGKVSGADGRFNGGIRKFYGMREVLDIDDVTNMGGIDAYDGPSYFKAVTFQKKDTSTVYRGFVIRWDSQNDNTAEQVDLIYTANSGTSWSRHAIWGCRSIAFTSGGTTEISIGDTITGATGGATAYVDFVVLSSGSWAGGDAAGTFYVRNQSGTFESENLNVGASTNLATIAGDTTNNSISSTADIDCAVDRGFLIVGIEGSATKTTYWNGSSIVTVSSGPGDFDTELTAPTLNTSSVNTSYQLKGNGTYQVAYRFYDSTRGIYSALSAPLTIHLDRMKTTYATGTITFNSGGDNSGLMQSGDIFTINSRTYEYISDSGSDVIISAASAADIESHAEALADAINGDSSAEVTATAQATSVLITASTRGSDANSYGLVVTVGGNDFSASGSTLSGGGDATSEPEDQCRATIDFPANTAVVSGEAYSDFAALFDTVDIFRTVNLGETVSTQGAIFYLESTIAKTGNWATSGTWDSLTAYIGSKVDDALPFQIMYDPEKDIIQTPPQSGTIGRYGRLTFMAQASSVDGGYDTLHSSYEHTSPEYFSTYNKRRGDPEDGRPLRFIRAGVSLFQLCYNSIVHIFKSGDTKPLQYTRLHEKRGIVGKGAAHSSGNSIFMVSGLGVAALNATDGSMGGISAADRVIFDDWKSYLSEIESCYDALMNCSFFLCPSLRQILCLWHSSRTVSFLEGANFVGASGGPNVSGTNDRAFFITATGLIVSPDVLEAGSGTMWDLASTYTLDSTVTTGGTTLTDTEATFHADMVGARLYITNGTNAGYDREIASVNTSTKVLTFTENFPYDIGATDRYSISPVPFIVRTWPLAQEELSPFVRRILMGVAVKASDQSGFEENTNKYWRVSAYRDREPTPEQQMVYISMDYGPGVSCGGLNIDGVNVTPYIEQISTGTMFELTDAEFAMTPTDSRMTGDEYAYGDGDYGSGRYGY